MHHAVETSTKKKLIQNRKTWDSIWKLISLALLPLLIFKDDFNPPMYGFSYCILAFLLLTWAFNKLVHTKNTIVCTGCNGNLLVLLGASKVKNLEQLQYCPFCSISLESEDSIQR